MNNNDTSIGSNIKIDFKKNNATMKKNTKKIRKINLNIDEALASNDFVIGPKEKPLKVIPLGGMEQVGENMTILEYEDDIIIIDAGMLMPGGEVFGVDYIIPDITYLKPKKSKIRGIIITHGHLDHIGALKHILADLNYPKVYATNLAAGIIKKTLEGTPVLKEISIEIVNPDVNILSLGCFTVEFFRVNHSIPEAMGLSINTPKGLLVTTGDFKIDYTPAVDKVADLAKIARIGQEGVKLFFSDSTNALKPGSPPSEKQIGESLGSVIEHSKSRLIIATYSSLIGRLSQIVDYAVKFNKIVFLSGRSLINNMEIAKELGYIKAPQGIVRKISDDVDVLPDDRVIILTTGSQGEEFSALTRIAKGEHQQIKLRPGDRVLLSAVPIPGNEMAVVSMINDLIRRGADVVTNKDMDIHVSGHAGQADLKMMLSLVKPDYFMPIHGELYMRHAHKNLAMELGMPSEKVFLSDNGNILEVYDNGVLMSPKRLKLDTVMIDGLGIGNMSGEYVMKARRIMSEDGMITLIFKVDSKNKSLVGNIQIESRGFVYSQEVKKVHTNIVEYVKKRYYHYLDKKDTVKDILKILKEELSEHLTKTIGRVPMIIPMFVYINRDSSGNIKDDMSDEYAIVGMTLEEQGKASEAI
ncbi:MAG: ribonuclease J [Candidatus Absconditabacteria bacterium]